jgi:hypothetical protein
MIRLSNCLPLAVAFAAFSLVPRVSDAQNLAITYPTQADNLAYFQFLTAEGTYNAATTTAIDFQYGYWDGVDFHDLVWDPATLNAGGQYWTRDFNAWQYGGEVPGGHYRVVAIAYNGFNKLGEVSNDVNVQ